MPDTQTATYITVDVWSDIACPWCYIGKRRLETALADFAATPGAPAVKVVYHSYELAPDTPRDFDGTEVDFLVNHKGLPAEQVQAMLAQVGQVAAAEGLAFNFDALQHTNTLRAHELIHFAKANGKQGEFVERLFRAYFIEGGHVGDPTTLAHLAGEIGLDAGAALAALTTNRYSAEVQADIAQANAYGITGVPFYVIDAKYGISGAQEPAAFVAALTQAATDKDAPDAAADPA